MQNKVGGAASGQVTAAGVAAKKKAKAESSGSSSDSEVR